MEILTYPSYLNSDEYALRKVTFTAMKNDAVEGEAEKMLQNALTVVDNWVPGNIVGAPDGFTSMGQIVLPIPATINDESAHSWGEETSITHDILNTGIQMLGSAASMAVGGAFMKAGGILGKVGKVGGNLTNGISLDKVMATGALLSGRRKTLLDPGYFQNYTGSKPRSFAMQWVLIPQNSGDAKTIHDIIITFKKWAAPSKALAGVTMLAPYFFNVQFSNPTISEMMKMDNCVCTGVDCSYSSQIFPDGMPRQITFSLRLAESRLTYSDNYNTGMGGNGGGTTFEDIGNSISDFASESWDNITGAVNEFGNSDFVQTFAQQNPSSTPNIFNQNTTNSVIKPQNS